MKIILEIINRKDRGTLFYDGSAFMRRHAYSQRRKKKIPKKPLPRSATTFDPTGPQLAVPHVVRVKPVGVEARTRRSAQSKIGRYKGGSTARRYDPQYHSQTKKRARRTARQTQVRKLSKKKYGRYSQLM